MKVITLWIAFFGMMVALCNSQLFASTPEYNWETFCANATKSFEPTTEFERNFVSVLCEGVDVANGSIVFSGVLLKKYLSLISENYPNLKVLDKEIETGLALIQTQADLKTFPRSPVFTWWSYRILLNFFSRAKLYFPSGILPQVNEVTLRLSKVLSVPFDVTLDQYDEIKEIEKPIKSIFKILSSNPLVNRQVSVLSKILELSEVRRNLAAFVAAPTGVDDSIGLEELRRRVRTLTSRRGLIAYDEIQPFLDNVSPHFFDPGRKFYQGLSKVMIPVEDGDLVKVFVANVFLSLMNYNPPLPVLNKILPENDLLKGRVMIEFLNAGLGIGGIQSFPRAPIFIRTALEILSTVESISSYAKVGQKPRLIILADELKWLSAKSEDFFEKPQWKDKFPESELRDVLKEEIGNTWIRGIQPLLIELIEFTKKG